MSGPQLKQSVKITSTSEQMMPVRGKAQPGEDRWVSCEGERSRLRATVLCDTERSHHLWNWGLQEVIRRLSQ